jgi:hypothetical protein
MVFKERAFRAFRELAAGACLPTLVEPSGYGRTCGSYAVSRRSDALIIRLTAP